MAYRYRDSKSRSINRSCQSTKKHLKKHETTNPIEFTRKSKLDYWRTSIHAQITLYGEK